MAAGVDNDEFKEVADLDFGAAEKFLLPRNEEVCGLMHEVDRPAGGSLCSCNITIMFFYTWLLVLKGMLPLRFDSSIIYKHWYGCVCMLISVYSCSSIFL